MTRSERTQLRQRQHKRLGLCYRCSRPVHKVTVTKVYVRCRKHFIDHKKRIIEYRKLLPHLN